MPSLRDEAQKCRAAANKLKGKPEAAFLMNMASAFEELHDARRTQPRHQA